VRTASLAHVSENGVQSDFLNAAMPMRRIESLVRALHEKGRSVRSDHADVEKHGVVTRRALTFDSEEVAPTREVAPSLMQRATEVGKTP